MLIRRLAILTALGVAGLVTATQPAFADRTTPTPGAGGNTISITVTGTGVRGGSGGQGGTRTVSKPVPCTYIQSLTGKEYYEWVKGGGTMGLGACMSQACRVSPPTLRRPSARRSP